MNFINFIFGLITRNIKRILSLLLAAILIAGVAVVGYDLAYDFTRIDKYETYDKNGEQVILDIPEGSSVSEISAMLKEKDLIESELLFRIKAKLTGAEEDFQYGVYTLIKGMPMEVIMVELQEGAKEESVTITIPEGWSVRQIARYLEEKEICLASDFEEACNRTDYNFDYYDLLTNASSREFLLEGYLWPDTYEVIPANGAEGVVKRMLREFERKWENNGEWTERMKEMGLTLDEVMTMASCIEREAQVSYEAPMVARTLFNRMDEGMTWGLNSTILYAMGKEGTGDDTVLYSDLEIKSGYNTYMYLGYPVGPICNPGRTAIEAVLEPAEGDWLYFIAYEDGTGEHLFTSDYSEFEAVFNGTYAREDGE
ncbi:MAG: endolytic transglycosylase MltG [Lachnospiraceae bacterium]|nr:endolytic transglycosylase MltG [Lachnospiraceae bacterium]